MHSWLYWNLPAACIGPPEPVEFGGSSRASDSLRPTAGSVNMGFVGPARLGRWEKRYAKRGTHAKAGRTEDTDPGEISTYLKCRVEI